MKIVTNENSGSSTFVFKVNNKKTNGYIIDQVQKLQLKLINRYDLYFNSVVIGYQDTDFIYHKKTIILYSNKERINKLNICLYC